MAIVQVKSVDRSFVAENSTQQAAQFNSVMDAEVKSKSPERIVDVGGVANKKHSALAKTCRYPLMDMVEIAVDNRIAPRLRKELLQPLLNCLAIE